MQTGEQRSLKISKFLSLVLRHDPEKIGISLDQNGWTDLGELVLRLAPVFNGIQLQEIEDIERNDSKNRYEIANGRIRAAQGHSVDIANDSFKRMTPPEFLFHGTTQSAWISIQQDGAIRSMQRHHVHLSEDMNTAREVGSRRKSQTLIVLKVDSGMMAASEHEFFIAKNGVWLTKEVPIQFATDITFTVFNKRVPGV
jgi:putative RNA 2'-phosphotransferase